MGKMKYVGIGLFFVLFLTGCAPKIAIEYRPKTVLEYNGQVAVNNFGYFPKEGVDLKQIPNTALGGGIILDEPIGHFVANAVRREFRQAGMSLKPGICRLDGEVNEILIDDLGFTVDYITDVRYILYDKDDKVLLDNNYRVNLDGMTKFVVAEVIFQNINKMFSNNIKQLMENPQFAKAMNGVCKK